MKKMNDKINNGSIYHDDVIQRPTYISTRQGSSESVCSTKSIGYLSNSSGSNRTHTSLLTLTTNHPYKATKVGQLSFPAGATILAEPGQEGNLWWVGYYGNEKGWFLPTYCHIHSFSSIPGNPFETFQAARSQLSDLEEKDDYKVTRTNPLHHSARSQFQGSHGHRGLLEEDTPHQNHDTIPSKLKHSSDTTSTACASAWEIDEDSELPPLMQLSNDSFDISVFGDKRCPDSTPMFLGSNIHTIDRDFGEDSVQSESSKEDVFIFRSPRKAEHSSVDNADEDGEVKTPEDSNDSNFCVPPSPLFAPLIYTTSTGTPPDCDAEYNTDDESDSSFLEELRFPNYANFERASRSARRSGTKRSNQFGGLQHRRRHTACSSVLARNAQCNTKINSKRKSRRKSARGLMIGELDEMGDMTEEPVDLIEVWAASAKISAAIDGVRRKSLERNAKSPCGQSLSETRLPEEENPAKDEVSITSCNKNDTTVRKPTRHRRALTAPCFHYESSSVPVAVAIAVDKSKTKRYKHTQYEIPGEAFGEDSNSCTDHAYWEEIFKRGMSEPDLVDPIDMWAAAVVSCKNSSYRKEV